MTFRVLVFSHDVLCGTPIRKIYCSGHAALTPPDTWANIIDTTSTTVGFPVAYLAFVLFSFTVIITIRTVLSTVVLGRYEPGALGRVLGHIGNFLWCRQPVPVVRHPAVHNHPAPSCLNRSHCGRRHCNREHLPHLYRSIRHFIVRLPPLTASHVSFSSRTYPADMAATAFQIMATTIVSFALLLVIIAAFTPPPMTGRLGLALGIALGVFSLLQMLAFSIMAAAVAECESGTFFLQFCM